MLPSIIGTAIKTLKIVCRDLKSVAAIHNNY
jgi:hypothetical protein